MARRDHVLAETNWKTVRSASFDVAVLPWGATEAHNYHLPYGTDTVQSEYIAAEAARRAGARGARVLVLPAVPYGVQTGQLDIPFCLNVNPSTQAALLSDLARSLAPHRVGKLVVLNGHGGNDFRQIIRELQPQVELFLCQVNWYRAGNPAGHFDEPGDHAGEMETSIMLHIAPELVLPLDEAGSGGERKARLRGLRQGWAWAPRRWTQVSADTGVGDPRPATAEKGSRYLDAVAEEIGEFLADLAQVDVHDLYTD